MSARWPLARAQRWPAPRWWSPLALYLVAALALLYRLPEWPPYLFNWENYTVWRYWRTWAGDAQPSLVFLQPTDGLMTDSGFGPLTGGPIWLGEQLGLAGVAMLRVPLALLAALAVPLLWALGRRLASEQVAVLAALLLAVSPVFVLYGRTATIVAVSLLPALGAMVALADVILAGLPGRRRWSLALLQVALAGGVFAYAPVRLLWPLAAGALLVAAVADRQHRRERVAAAALTIAGVPAVLLALAWLHAGDPNVPATVGGYFRARGEQLMSFGTDPAAFVPYLRVAPEATSPVALATALVRQNAGDLGRLLLDWRTEPTALQFWSQRGQLWPALHAVCFLIGLRWLVVAALRVRDGRAALWLWLLAGLTLPLLATSQVHVGRLVPALPVLTVAQGGWISAAWLWRGIARRLRLGERAAAPPLLSFTLAGGLVGVSVVTTGYGYSLLAPTDATAPVIAVLRRAGQSLPRGAGVAVVAPAAWGAEIESVRASALWLALGGEFTVVDLSRAQAERGDDGRPPLYAGGVREALAAGELPDPCTIRFVAWPEAGDELAAFAASVATRARCLAGPFTLP